MDWLRIDADMPDHAKVRALARRLGVSRPHATGYVVWLLCHVARLHEDGALTRLDPLGITEVCGYEGNEDEFVAALVASGWLEEGENGLVVHGWLERQGSYIRHRENQRAYRKRRVTSPCDQRGVSVTSPCLPTVHDSTVRDSTGRKTKSTRPAAPDAACGAPAPAVSIEWGAEVWARHCSSLPQPRAPFSDKRKRSWATRCREPGFLDTFEDVCRKVGASEFCQGKGRTGWAATFDWLLERADAWQKVLEGKYDNRAPALPAHRTAGANPYHQEQLARLRAHEEVTGDEED